MSHTLYRTYRPQQFSDVIGQEHIITTLTNAITRDRIAHAYLFTGGRGTGKTTTARLFAQAVNCMERDGFTVASETTCRALASGASPDIIEIDAASHTGVDNIRDLRETVALAPHDAAYKTYIIDEVHMLSTGAFNALLKTLEEPPAHAIFILATTDIHKVPDTIISRCQRFDFARLSIPHIVTKIQKITTTEGITISSEAAELIAIAADGAMRDAESILAQVIAREDTSITAEDVAHVLGLSARSDVFTLIDAFVARDTQAAITQITAVAQSGYDLHAFARILVTMLRSFLFLCVDETRDADTLLAITTEERDRLLTATSRVTPEEVMLMIRLCEEARLKITVSTIPSLPLELAALDITRRSGASHDRPDSTDGAKPQKIPKKSAKPTSAKNHTPQKSPTPQKTTTSTPRESVATKQHTNQSDPATEPGSAPSSDTLTLAMIRDQWDTIIQGVTEINATLASTLRNAAPTKLDTDRLTVTVKYPLHKEKIDARESTLTLQNVLATIFTTSLTIVTDVAQNRKRSPEEAHVLTHATHLLGGEVVAE